MTEQNDLPDVPDLVAPKHDVTAFPYDIAVIIDDTVFQIMNVDGQQAAQFLSQPRFVRILPGDLAKIGWKYVDGKFSYPGESQIEGF
jgi:hypothetical protein